MAIYSDAGTLARSEGVPRTPHWIERITPLPLWGRMYAQWLVKQDAELTRAPGLGYRRRLPSNADRVTGLSRLLGRRVHPEWVRRIEKRADFAEYFGRLQTNPRFLAREFARQRTAENIRARCAALEEAQRTGDMTAIEQLTRWVVEIAFRPPRTRRQQPPPTIVTIGSPAQTPAQPADTWNQRR